MGEKNILFFADSSQDTSSFLETIVHAQQTSSPLLSSFLEKSRVALREEWSKLPSSQRAALPNFQTLDSIFKTTNKDGNRHPALHLVEVVLVQLAYFINAHERSPRTPYPSKDNSVCVGVCFGEVAAAAVALSTSLTDLIPLAVDAVRLAFRGGIFANAVGNDIEGRETNRGTWALSVPRDTGLDSLETLAALQHQLKIGPHKSAWVSALGHTSITLSGPPSTLDVISEHLLVNGNSNKVQSLRRLAISAPYHAQHIFSRSGTDTLLTQPTPLASLQEAISDAQQKVFIGGSAEPPRNAGSATDLFQDALFEIYATQIDWKGVVASCKAILGSDASGSTVKTFGPDYQGRYLASSLEKLGASGLSFDAEFSKVASSEATFSSSSPLAIVGMSGRFPSAMSPNEFWQNLSNGKDCVQELPSDRFDKTVHFGENKVFGNFMEKPGHFDPRFFHMSPREATNTDPAHRVGLTTVQEALDMAGVVKNTTPSTNADKIGTFWGSATEEYKEEYMCNYVDPYFIPGSSRAFGPGRVNFVYNFDGPAVSFDTACSSSMIAMNHACNSVWNNDCGTAIVVGTNILTAPFSYKGLDMGHFLSKTGGCKSFDEHADGYCRGEAVATVIIKKLENAYADNDNILGVIRAISTNHSSHASSITRPHGPTQATLFRRLLQQANLKPTDVSYAEMHGTGTQAGDTVEMNSVSEVLAPTRRGDENPLYIGAVKANVGHGEGVSGITSLVKALLMMREQKIPPHVGIKSGIRRKEPDLTPLNVNISTELIDWKTPIENGKEVPRRVLISNFSAAGGNTAMILEEPTLYQKPTPTAQDTRTSQLIAVSGKTAKALENNMRKLLDWTRKQSDLNLSDLSYTTTVRRPQYEFKHSFVAPNQRTLQEQMDRRLTSLGELDHKPSKVRIVFSGYTNTQSPAMQELFETSSFFRSEVQRLDQSVKRMGYPSVLGFFNGSTEELSFVQRQHSYVIAQLAMFRLAISWGIKPSAITGHSLGEYVALCASGIISSDDMIYLVGVRATSLANKCEMWTHGMLAVRTSVDDAQNHLGAEWANVEVSCINSPSDVVLGGKLENLKKAQEILSAKSIQCTLVDTPLAFHSSQMDPVADELMETQTRLTFNDPTTTLLSPTLCSPVDKREQIPADFFKRHTRGAVDFCGALLRGHKEDPGAAASNWLEIGPHSITSSMFKATLGQKAKAVPLMKKEQSIWITAPSALSTLFNNGAEIDWKEYHRDFEAYQTLLDIPTYHLEEQHYWLPPKPAMVPKSQVQTQVVAAPAPQAVPEELDIKLKYKSVHKQTFRSIHDGYLLTAYETDLLDRDIHEVMSGHSMNDSYLLPASLYTDIALAIADHLRENEFEGIQAIFRASVAHLDIHKPIIGPHRIEGAAPLSVRIMAVSDLHDKRTKLRFETKSAEGETSVHAQCLIYFEKKTDWVAEWAKEQPTINKEIGNIEGQLFRGLSQKLSGNLVYRLFDNVVIYGKKFRSMKEVLVDETQLKALTSVELYKGPDCAGYVLCPYWQDALIHLAGFLVNGLRQGADKAVYISPGWANFRMADGVDPDGNYKAFVTVEDHGSTVNAECWVLLGDKIVGKVDGLKFQLLPRSIINRVLPPGGGAAPKQIQQRHSDEISVQSAPSLDYDTPASDESSLADSDSLPGTPDFEEEDAPKVSLSAIICDETGVSLDDISADTEMLDLGIDSLLSLTISDRLRDEYNLKMLPTDLFQTHTTFGALEKYIQSVLPKPNRAVVIPKPPKQAKAPKPAKKSSTKTQAPAPVVEQPKPKAAPAKDDDRQKQKLRSIIADQMGVEVANLSITENLFDLGLDSLMSLEIVEALRDDLGIDLDPNFFLNANTIEEIEKVLFQSMAPPLDLVEDKPSPPTPVNQKLSVLLQGDPKTCSKKLWMFPDGSGSAGVYSRLPTIDGDVCVYGLNSPWLKQGVVLGINIADMVRQWVREIKNTQLDGPYNLAGYSSGGYYAYEAAKVMMEDKQTIANLILIDSPSRSAYDALPEDVLDVVVSSGIVGDGGQTPKWLEDHFRSSIKAVEQYKPMPMAGQFQPKTYLIFASSGIEQFSSKMQSKGKFDNGIVKFFSGERGPIRPHGWADLIGRENIQMAKTPGNHFDLVLPPNADTLSSLVASALYGKSDSFEGLPDGRSQTVVTAAWQPSCASFDMDQLRDYLSRKTPQSELSLKHQLDLLVKLYSRRVLDNVAESETRSMPQHFQRFYRWMQEMKPVDLPDVDVATLEADVEKTGVDGAMTVRIGRNILPIFRGQTQPLELMLQEKLLYDYYPNNIHTAPCFPQVEVLVRQQLEVSKTLNILEIGAGTGGTTKAMFRAIVDYEGAHGKNPGFGHYTYTDISAGFFRRAKDTFKPHVDRMTFKKLDIEEPPADQGYELAKFDLIIASQCLHATKDMTRTMTHVRQLLRPGGKIIMVEGTKEALDISFIFGTLSGWWLGVEPTRQMTPCFDTNQWLDLMKATGFNGADLVVRNRDIEEDHSLSIIMSTAV